MDLPQTIIKLHAEATQALIAQVRELDTQAEDDFAAAQALARLLGVHPTPAGYAQVGFWTPELVDKNISPERIFLEVLHPLQALDFAAPQQQVTFSRQRVPLQQDGDYLWGIVEGMTPGTREQIGSFYWVVYQDTEGAWHRIHDHMACSIPYGVWAPAEYYDLAGMLARRADKAHYTQLQGQIDADGYLRVDPPTNILQLHIRTASQEGTLAGLTRIYHEIADKLRAGHELSPAEKHYLGYDAVQLMPIEPPIEHGNGPLFWEALDDDPTSDSVTVQLRAHDVTNWGYDVMISASPAVNPVLLSSKRPDEFLDFIEVLHAFPEKPIMVMLDIVYGHADNQAVGLLSEHYLAGANMYGQNLDYLHPVVRANIIEMQRRKHNYGVDGIRVDGAQDFKYWEPESDTMIHDDDFLQLMNDIVLEVDGNAYRPWMIFEDGRPWPRDDWELSSSYREVTKRMPNVWQWGPLTFAHNTPFLFTFWVSKWWRIQQMTQVGEKWITGCANHDTVRRGTQVDPVARINTYLGNSMGEIMQKAYDNPAVNLFDYAMMPGVPMNFLNAAMRAPWGFIRNTDDKYGVKVVSEEARFSQWSITEERYDRPYMFTRLKAYGYSELRLLRRFIHALDHSVQVTAYDLSVVVRILNAMDPPLVGSPFDIDKVKAIAYAWMEDMHEYCNVSYYRDGVDPEQAAFSLSLREFRRERPWLMQNFREGESLDRLHIDGSVIFFGWRRAPAEAAIPDEELLFICNMEGAPYTLTPSALPLGALSADGWEPALVVPTLHYQVAAGTLAFDHEITLHDSEGVVFRRVER